MLYTSGSTGSPKGIIQRQQNLLHVAMLYHRDLGVGPTDRIRQPDIPGLHWNPMGFARGVDERRGVCFHRAGFRPAFVETLDKEKITVVQLIVSLLRQVTQSFDEEFGCPDCD